MIDGNMVEYFAKEPNELIKLCQEVIKQLKESQGQSNYKEQYTQLHAINKAIESLERSGVAVPESLRAEKTKLAANHAFNEKVSNKIANLTQQFQEIINTENPNVKKSTRMQSSNGRGKRSTNDITPQKRYRELIINVLKKFGGKAEVSDIIEEIELQLDGKLLPGDLQLREGSNESVWRNKVRWERANMKKDGILRSDSPHGFWELNEKYL